MTTSEHYTAPTDEQVLTEICSPRAVRRTPQCIEAVITLDGGLKQTLTLEITAQ
jgi:hypothetical protein